MDKLWFLIFALALGTFAIKVSGYLLAQTLPRDGFVVRSLNALPGTLVTALVTVILLQGTQTEWIAALLAIATAIFTRNLPLTMVVGVFAVFLLRYFTGN